MYSNEALPQPISKRKDKEHKKKKLKVVAALNATEAEAGSKTVVNALPEVAAYNTVAPANVILDKKSGWSLSIKIGNARKLSMALLIAIHLISAGKSM